MKISGLEENDDQQDSQEMESLSIDLDSPIELDAPLELDEPQERMSVRAKDISDEHLLLKCLIDHGVESHSQLSPKDLTKNVENSQRHRIRFSDPDLAYIYKVITEMNEKNGGVPDFVRLRKSIKSDIRADKRREQIDQALTQVQSSVFRTKADILKGAQFSQCVRDVRNSILAHKTQEVYNIGAEIVNGKVTIGKKEYSGNADAQSYVSTEIAELNKEYGDYGDVVTSYDTYVDEDAQELIQELNKTKDSGASIHERLMPWSIPMLNDLLTGIGHNELVAVCAYTSQLKTSLCIHQAMRTTLAGFNVLYLCYEQVVREIMPKFHALYAQNDIFKARYPGKYGDLTSNYFSPERTPETRAYDDYIEDVVQSFNKVSQVGDAGRLLVKGTPTMDIHQVWALAETVDAQWKDETGFGIDMIVIDYLAIMPEGAKAYSDRSANLNQKVLEARKMTNAFAGGRGVTIVTPWQVSRGAYEKIKKNGGILDATHPSDANELERSVSSAIGIFYDEEHRRQGKAKISWLKSRHAGMFDPFTVRVKPQFNWFENWTENSGEEKMKLGDIS